MGDTSYESIYSGGYSSLDPDNGNFIGYRMNANNIGFPGSPQTANQLNETVNAIKQGVKVFEVSLLNADTVDAIPHQHFEEMRALMKLTGVKPSVHGPIVDPAGFGQRGWEGDQARFDSERRMFETIEKAHKLDPTGNVPIVFHSSAGIPGPEYIPDKDKQPGEEGRFHEKKLILINQDSGQMVPVEEEKEYLLSHPEDFEKGGTLRVPREEIEDLNKSEWQQKLTNLSFYEKHADEVITPAMQILEQIQNLPKDKEHEELIKQREAFAISQLEKANNFITNVGLSFNSAFKQAYEYGTNEQRQKLTDLAKEYRKEVNETKNDSLAPLRQKESLDKAIMKLTTITMKDAPQVYKPVEEFAMDKSAETFGNLAFKSYEKFKDKSPIIAVENMYQGMAFSRAEDMQKLVEKSRKIFVEQAKEKGMSEDAAKNQAEKILGVTWDVGHLNMMRKSGFNEKDIQAETKKIAPLVKHVHLTDNFGYSDSHLPPGMGNVPFKQILEELEKTGRLDKMTKIVEAGGFVQHFKQSPHPWTLSAFGSPIYGAKMASYWNQASGLRGNYFSSPMAYLPEKHFSMYGTGFSMLPEELGGQIPGTQSRFSGASNA